MSVKITPDDWEQFKKHYMFEFLRNADYRFGQAFLNYFPKLSKQLLEDGDRGESIEQRLWNAKTQSMMTHSRSFIKLYVGVIGSDKSVRYTFTSSRLKTRDRFLRTSSARKSNITK